MTIDISEQVVIKSTTPFAWEYLAEPLNLPDWHEQILTAKWNSPKPLKLGTQVACTGKLMTRPIDFILEVTVLEAEKHLVLNSISGPFQQRISLSVNALFEGTIRVTARHEAEPTGPFKLLGGMIKGGMTTSMEKDMEKLKILLEKRFKEKNF